MGWLVRIFSFVQPDLQIDSIEIKKYFLFDFLVETDFRLRSCKLTRMPNQLAVQLQMCSGGAWGESRGTGAALVKLA